MARLIVVEGDAAQRQVTLAHKCTVGRGPECDLVLFDAATSRHHLRLEREEPGETQSPWTVIDLGSSNGTMLNGRPVREALLCDGDEILIGATRLRFLGSCDAAILQNEGLVITERIPVRSFEALEGNALGPRLRSAWSLLESLLPTATTEELAGELARNLPALLPCREIALLLETASGRLHRVLPGPHLPSGASPALLAEAGRHDEALLLETLLIAPLLGPTRCLGFLFLDARAGATFHREHLELMATLGAPLGALLASRERQAASLEELERLRLRLGAGERPATEVAAFSSVLDELEKRASESEPLLLVGEQGVGKKTIAHWVHSAGPRRDQPFLTLFCPPLEEETTRREILGVERAVSGARQEGLLARSSRGTLLLESIASCTSGVQKLLAEVLSSARYRPLGANRGQPLKTRLILTLECRAGAPADLGALVPSLRDLLAPRAIAMPSLRQRGPDLPHLARRHLARLRREIDLPARSIAPEALEALRRRPWPGNLRELRLVLELAALRCRSDHIQLEDLGS